MRAVERGLGDTTAALRKLAGWCVPFELARRTYKAVRIATPRFDEVAAEAPCSSSRVSAAAGIAASSMVA